MSRLSIFMLLVIGSLIGLACASGAPTSPSATPDLTGQIATPGNHVSWGVYDLVLNPEKGTVDVVLSRTAGGHFDVTSKVKPPTCYDCVVIQNPSYNSDTHHFTVDIQMKNPTNLSGNDVRGIISDPGGYKYLANPDGVTTFWGPPLQYKAFNVDGDRKFGAMSVQTRTFDFYLPVAEGFKTLTYIIDTSVPGAVDEPLAEKGVSDPLVNNDFTTTFLRTTIFDHQSDLAAVNCDLMPLGGSPVTPMFDDGAHNDGAAGDHVYGITGVKTSVAVGLYMINVYPTDGAGHTGWGQIPVSVQKTTGGGDNHDPAITKVISDRTTANGGANEKIKITVTANDVDGDTLSYQFQGTGTFTGQVGGVVNWKPDSSKTGAQTISIKALDGKGGEATSSIKLWSTNLTVINGNTQGKLPEATIESIIPVKTLKLGTTDFPGKVVYINFWATWCGYCVAEMPELTNIYNSNKSNPDYVQIYMDLQESGATVQGFVSSNSFACTFWALDTTGSYFGKCSALTGNGSGIPQHLLFDRDNKCRWTHVGALSDPSELANDIKQLL